MSVFDKVKENLLNSVKELSSGAKTENILYADVEVKASDNATKSLCNLIEKDKYGDIHYGIKLCKKNIGFNGKFYTFPYFCCFMLKKYLQNFNQIHYYNQEESNG